MHFLIIGGSGRTGKLIIEDALSRGHTITALVRSTSSLTLAKNLIITTGEVTSQEDITRAINSTPTPPTAVVIALSSLRNTESPFSAPISPPHLMTDTQTAAIAAMRLAGIKRIITISSFGVGESEKSLIWPMRYLLHHFGIGVTFADHNGVECVVRKEAEKDDLEWTLVKPAMLSKVARPAFKEAKTFGENGEGIGMFPGCSRETVAEFLVRDCLEGSSWVGKTPVIAE